MRLQHRSTLLFLTWHGLAALMLACLPVLKYHLLWWDLSSYQLVPFMALLGTYVASVLAVVLLVRDDEPRSVARTLAVALSVFCFAFAALLFARIETPRYLLTPFFFAALVLLPISIGAKGFRTLGAVALGVAFAATAGFAALTLNQSAANRARNGEEILRTTFYNVAVATHADVVPMPATRGGGLAQLGSNVLLGDGGGLLYELRFDAQGAPHARRLPTQVPLNREQFAATYGGSAQAPSRLSEYAETGPPRVQTWRFRVADVLTSADGDALRLFASHHQFDAERECFFVRVSMIEASLSALDETLRSNAWRTMYDSSPCIPMRGEDRKLGKNPFKGEEIGGRMALLDRDTLLLTLGDHGFSGLESLQAFSQDPVAHYGKTLRIDLNTGESRIHTLGHRNPQGVYVAPDGRIWLAEHAQQSGDEVNLLTPGANYGWPLVTYGTDYGAFAWPLSTTQGRHAGFTPPAHAWAPSIGISALIGIEGDLFDIWRGDLLAGSLATRSLYRLVIEGDRIVLDERIDLDVRVRDLMELTDGRLLVWGDEGVLLTIAPATGMSGALTYATMCTGCHLYVDGMTHRIGPDLLKIVGRPIASASGFDNYSNALRDESGTWTRERLDAFLRDPQAFAPGTTMAFPGIPNDAERAALIEHMETFTAPPER